jgi:hypothetical protein
MNILHINQQNKESDLRLRFPSDKYTIIEIPYVLVNPKSKRIRILEPDEIHELTEDLALKLKYVKVVIKKFTWSIKNDLIRRSQGVNQRTFKRETNRDLYVKNLLKELLVYIVDDGDEAFVDSTILERLTNDFVEGFVSYFFRHPHFDTMDDDEESELMRHIHSYYSYWRKVNSNRATDHVNVSGKEPPICPSIIIEVGLADRFHWTFDYIRSLSEKDIRSIQILQSQKEIADFEGSDEARKMTAANGKKVIKRNLTYKEAQELVKSKTTKTTEAKESAPVPTEILKAEDKPKPAAEKPLSKAEEHVKRLKKVRRG